MRSLFVVLASLGSISVFSAGPPTVEEKLFNLQVVEHYQEGANYSVWVGTPKGTIKVDPSSATVIDPKFKGYRTRVSEVIVPLAAFESGLVVVANTLDFKTTKIESISSPALKPGAGVAGSKNGACTALLDGCAFFAKRLPTAMMPIATGIVEIRASFLDGGDRIERVTE